MNPTHDRDEHVQEITAAVEAAIERLDARDKAAEAVEREKAAKKEKLAERVSVAAIALTMLMSFLGFARSERDDSAKDLRTQADKARREAEANWTLYQTRAAERAGFVTADDALAREVATLGDGDPRMRIAELNHVEYATRVAQLDNESRRVFFVIQDLNKGALLALRQAHRIDSQIERYDLGTRVLTLALVILSVVLLASQQRLFWVGVLVSFIGAGIAVSGYFIR
jgi:hypothetical protein